MLTEEQAQEMLKQLEEHYKQPVMPLSNFCDAIKTWFRCIETVNKRMDGFRQGYSYYQHLYKIERDIKKSNLLYRLLYKKEPLRIEECPEHKGKYSGIEKCSRGCEGTGWLPNNLK